MNVNDISINNIRYSAGSAILADNMHDLEATKYHQKSKELKLE